MQAPFGVYQGACMRGSSLGVYPGVGALSHNKHLGAYLGVGRVLQYYRIPGKFGGELNLAVWRSARATAKLKSAKISYSNIYVWQSCTKPPNLNPPIRLQWQSGSQPPNLIPQWLISGTI